MNEGRKKKKRETFHETREGELERFYGGVYFRILRSRLRKCNYGLPAGID